MSNTGTVQSIQEALDVWSDDGGQWLDDAERMLVDAHRLIREIERREEVLLENEQRLELEKNRLEQQDLQLAEREAILNQREKLLTEGMLQISQGGSADRTNVEPLLDELYDEIASLRESLKNVLPGGEDSLNQIANSESDDSTDSTVEVGAAGSAKVRSKKRR